MAICFPKETIAELSQKSTEPEYVMGPGDSIEISVWGHDLKKEMRIRPDGKISFYLIDDVRAAGVTPSALRDEIQKRLSKYIKEPKVSVIVMGYKSKQILVIGDVEEPGLYQYEGNMTAFDAIGLAEGYGKHAELKSILVARDAYSDNPQFYVANLYKAIHDADLSENILLQPGDIIYIPKNFLGNVGDFMDYFISRVHPIATSYLYYQQEDED